MQMSTGELVNYLNERIMREEEKKAAITYGDETNGMTSLACPIQSGISEGVFSIETENNIFIALVSDIRQIEVKESDSEDKEIIIISFKNDLKLSIVF